MEITTPDEAEWYVTDLAGTLTEPDGRECLLCYVLRMLRGFGCDTTLRWARRWRDIRLPRAVGLERRLGARGGFCDCEIFWNGWDLRPELQVVDAVTGEPGWPEQLAGCAGVDRRSSQPCALWAPRRRRRW